MNDLKISLLAEETLTAEILPDTEAPLFVEIIDEEPPLTVSVLPKELSTTVAPLIEWDKDKWQEQGWELVYGNVFYKNLSLDEAVLGLEEKPYSWKAEVNGGFGVKRLPTSRFVMFDLDAAFAPIGEVLDKAEDMFGGDSIVADRLHFGRVEGELTYLPGGTCILLVVDDISALERIRIYQPT